MTEDLSQTQPLIRALLLAELSMIAYLPPDQTKIAGKALGFDNDGSQAYVFSNNKDIFIAFRAPCVRIVFA